MENLEATQALAQAERVRREARHSARWYALYLTFFGVASAVFAGLFGFVGNRWGALVLTPLWGLFVGLLSVWSQRKKTALAGMTRLHLVVIGSWAVLWGITVVIGSIYFQGRPGWWLAGGLALATPCLIGARIAYRRTT